MLLVFCSIFSLVPEISTETNPNDRLKNELELLEEIIDASSNSGLDSIERHLEELIEKSLGIKNEALTLIEEHALDVAENFQIYVNALTTNENNVSLCHDGLDDAVINIQEKGIKKLKTAIDSILLKSRGVIFRSVPILTKIQNKTLEMRRTGQNCVQVEDERCLDAVFERIETAKETVTSIIQTVMDRLEVQIRILESEMISGVQKIINVVLGSYSDILFNFIQCII